MYIQYINTSRYIHANFELQALCQQEADQTHPAVPSGTVAIYSNMHMRAEIQDKGTKSLVIDANA